MKNFRLIACALCALAIAFLESGCADGPSGGAPVRELRTYAIVATDDQGTLSPTELNSIVDTLVQFLLDQGYVRSDQVLVDDPGRAAAVFRMKIAWNEGRTSFAVVSVMTGSGNTRVYPGPAPAYATSALPTDAEPSDALPPDNPPPHAPPPGDWSEDPWVNDDGFGYPYGPYNPFWVWFPLGSYYGRHLHHPPPPFFRRPPNHDRPSEHRTHNWSQYRHHGPPTENIPGSRPRQGGSPQRQSPSRHNGSAEAPHSAPEHRSRPANPDSSRPQTRAPDRSPAPDHSSHRPDSDKRSSPTTNPPHKPDPQRTAPPTAAVTPRQPTQPPRSSPPQPWGASQPRQQSTQTAPDRPARRPDSNASHSPATISQRASPAPVAVPPREPAQTVHSSPPTAVPPREPAQTARSSPPPRQDSVQAGRNSPPPVAHASAPASSSRSDSDSKSKTRNR
jgi:hypothetical protein